MKDLSVNRIVSWFVVFVLAGAVTWTGTTVNNVSLKIERLSATSELNEGRLQRIEDELVRLRRDRE